VPLSRLTVALVASRSSIEPLVSVGVRASLERDDVGQIEDGVFDRLADVVDGVVAPALLACLGVVGRDRSGVAAAGDDDRLVVLERRDADRVVGMVDCPAGLE